MPFTLTISWCLLLLAGVGDDIYWGWEERPGSGKLLCILEDWARTESKKHTNVLEKWLLKVRIFVNVDTEGCSCEHQRTETLKSRCDNPGGLFFTPALERAHPSNNHPDICPDNQQLEQTCLELYTIVPQPCLVSAAAVVDSSSRTTILPQHFYYYYFFWLVSAL